MFENDYLMHHGIKGQKWGVRRYQNTDGSWTAAGRARYSKGGGNRAKYGSENINGSSKVTKKVEKLNKKIDKLNLKMQNGAARTYGYSEASGYTKKHPYDTNIESRDIFRSGREKKLKKLQDKRNALDPSQKNRSGRILTKEEFNRQYNKAIANQLNGGDPIASAVSTHLLNKSNENSHDKEYNQYVMNATAYGSKKKAKYGTRLNAYDRNRVAMLNDEIDALNYDYQRSHAGAKAALASKPKAYAKLEAAKLAYPGALAGLGIGGALATYMSSPKQAALAFGGGTLMGALGGAAIGSHSATKKFKKEIKSFKDEPYDPEIKRELNSLIAERNHLDPSQKNRKGRVITKEEYSDAYNLGRNMLEGGNKHKGLVSDEIYNDYLKNTTTYGSKKNAKYGSQLDPKTAKRVEELNKQIDKENLKLQKRNARSYGYDQASLKKAAAAGAVTGAAINAASARDHSRLINDLLGSTPAEINLHGRRAAVSGGIVGAGLGVAAGALKGAAIKAVGKSSVGKTSRESRIRRMIAERNELDPSQASRKGRTLTKEEFNRQVNAAKGATLGGSAAPNLLSPIGAVVGSAVGSRSTKGKNTYDYNDYLKNTTTYGSKKRAKYGSKKYYSEADILKDFKDNYDDIDDPEERELVKDLLDSYGYSGKKKRR